MGTLILTLQKKVCSNLPLVVLSFLADMKDIPYVSKTVTQAVRVIRGCVGLLIKILSFIGTKVYEWGTKGPTWMSEQSAEETIGESMEDTRSYGKITCCSINKEMN